MKDLRLVVFDMAGTTIKDNGQVPQSFTAALEEHGLTVTPEQLASVRGTSKRHAVVELILDTLERVQRAEVIYNSFCTKLTQRYKADGIEPMDGAADIFEWLRTRDIRVALNTGFDRDITDMILSSLHWETGVVDAVICGDDVPQGRPAPYLIFRAMEATGILSTQQVMNVGDTVMDLQAGHNAGVRWNVGVLSGAHNQAQLQSAPHTHLFSSIREIPGLSDND